MGNIILYSTGCPKCFVLETKLKQKNIDYVVNNSVDDMEKVGMTEVPSLSVDGELKGFMDAVEWVNNQ